MTNPYQAGSPGAQTDPNVLPWFGHHRSSYARVASGAPNYPTPGSFSHLLNPVQDGADGQAHDAYAADASAARDGSEHNGASLAPWLLRNPQLPLYSRAFEPVMRGHPSDGLFGMATNNTFFTPSYLQDSAYAQKLEEVHKKRLSAQRDAQQTGGLTSSGSSISLHSSKLAPATHRGMAFEVVEKPPPFEEQESVAALPTRWNHNDKHPSVDVLSDGLEIKYAGSRSSSDRDHEAYAIRADHYMPPQCGLYYFEVTILKKRDETTIGIGFMEGSVTLTRAPGWEPNSWGYHGDDGNVFASQNVGKHYGPTFTAGDVIGCGVNFRTGTAFYTKNGQHLGVAFRDVKGSSLKLFPTVGLKKSGEHIRVNFGQTPFVFDIDGVMKAERSKIRDLIDRTSTANLAPPLDETELVQQLVLQFLQHDGYVETARAFASEIQEEKRALSLDENAEVQGINIADDEDANNRQRIRRAILEGDIDRALKLTNAYYPQVLQDNEQVHFRLRCRKFIEMIRREAELNMTGSWDGSVGARSNGHHNHAMDIDDEDDEPDGEEDVEEEDDAAMQEQQGSTAIQQQMAALEYGQALHAEFGSDPRAEVRKALDEIFSLMAYSNPLKEKEVAHLLDRKGRATVAEELNSAILQSLGQSSRAALETVIAQTTVLLEDLRQDGGVGSFVTLGGYVMDQIPKSQPF